MNSSNPAGNLPSQQGYPPPVPDQQFQKPVFNQEELRVLRECNLESFYYRCVPLAAAFTSATYIAMRRGIFKVSEKFGYTPKMLGAAFIGYFAGKLSYQNACAEKLMKLPNSPVGEALRKRKGRLGFQESLSMEPGFSVAFPGEKDGSGFQQPIFDDHRPDLRDHNEGLDEYQRGVTDSLTPYTEVPLESAQSYTTYEELRRQNREEYVNRMADKYRKLPADLASSPNGFVAPVEDIATREIGVNYPNFVIFSLEASKTHGVWQLTLEGVMCQTLLQVALKRQQAAEDAIALTLRVAATGTTCPFLPQGPIYGLPVTEPHIKGQLEGFMLGSL
ncbi:hypothetical protein C7M84_021896 [Penaeus vannamei]|uniref:OCIA domain-containing protein n=1 Tax=Penaeus vannamei TaxID=6689 RepID=A0A423U889_PENVA|nr:hypothetical protein C7M84_021896 [Penaeus vannamei]